MSAKPALPSPVLFGQVAVSRLLVPVVGDQRPERGVAVAMQLAAAWGTPVVLLHIGPLDTDEVGTPSAVASMAIDLRHRHPEVAIETLVFDHADIAVAIAGEADEGTLIVLATDHVSQWLGEHSVAEELVQRGLSPLLLIGPKAVRYRPEGEVVVTLDGTPLAEDGVAVGRAVAATGTAGVRVVSVVATATLEHIEHLKERGQRVSESIYLRSLADRMSGDGPPLAWEILHGDDVIDSLVALAARRDAALIVATTHAGTGVLRQHFGSTSMGLVEHSTVPVLIVQPGGARVQ